MQKIFYKLATIMFMLFNSVAFAQTPPIPETHTQDQPVFTITSSNPTFIIKLKSNPTTGYSWYLTNYNSGIIEPVKHEFEAPKDKKMIGAPGYELWTFKVKPTAFVVPRQTTIRFIYARSWEKNPQPQEQVFIVTTSSAL